MMEDTTLQDFTPEVFVGKGERGGSSDSRQRQVVENFTRGLHKILVSTSIGEEGMDFPECNVAVRYDYVRDEKSMIQSSKPSTWKVWCYGKLLGTDRWQGSPE